MCHIHVEFLAAAAPREIEAGDRPAAVWSLIPETKKGLQDKLQQFTRLSKI